MTILKAALVFSLVVGVACDVRRASIPPWLGLLSALVSLSLRALHEGLGDASVGAISGLLGWVATFLCFGVFAWRRSLGWGDACLAAGAGAALGWATAPRLVVLISLVGAFEAVVSLLWQGSLSATVARIVGRNPNEQMPKTQIPYGVAIAIGTIWAMMWNGNGNVLF